jgi:peptidoglycan/LPS O-acetylase OafA/YrhL
MIRINLPPLTGVRFFAAFFVLVGHTTSTLFRDFDQVRWMDAAAPIGMTIFFVLSGFVIHYNYGTLVSVCGNPGRSYYLRARFARLYPLYLLMLAVYLCLSSRTIELIHGHPERFHDILRSLPFFAISIQSWIYWPVNANDSLISGIGGGSPLTWSISTEIFFYFAFLFFAGAIVQLRNRWAFCAMLIWSSIWMCAVAFLIAQTPRIDAWSVSKFGDVASLSHGLSDSFVYWLTYMSPYVRIGDFILGCLVAQVYTVVHGRGIVLGVLGLLAVSCVGAALMGVAKEDFVLAPVVAATILFALSRETWFTKFLSWRPILALGDASYSIYLTHYVILTFLARVIPDQPWIALVAAYATIIPLSLFLYSNYEAPMRRWLVGSSRPVFLSSTVQ